MIMQKKISRHKFFKLLSYALLLPLIYLLNKMVKDQQKFKAGNREIKLVDPPMGLSISGPVIISKTKNGMSVFSSKCTHLGCEINKVENEEIVCPCHGSRYNKDGEPTKGPSVKGLKKLDYFFNKNTNEWVVKL